MATFNNVYQSIDELIRHSDKLMYEEKHKKAAGNLSDYAGF
ncbi:MAG: hypothetical protein GX075_09000 [Firmicutes bacterium]|nr:hypothetical protein [Bacillota bacterium]